MATEIKEARALRDTGIEQVTAAETAGYLAWLPQAEAALARRVHTGKPFTIDDLRREVDAEPHHRNAWGALMHSAARRDEIRKVGYRQSSRRDRRGAVVAVWRAA